MLACTVWSSSCRALTRRKRNVSILGEADLDGINKVLHLRFDSSRKVEDFVDIAETEIRHMVFHQKAPFLHGIGVLVRDAIVCLPKSVWVWISVLAWIMH